MSGSNANVDRRERLRQLAMDTIGTQWHRYLYCSLLVGRVGLIRVDHVQADITKDPYFMKNHLGSYECKLCLTLHNNEGNYLAHTQGKRHQTNLARRAAREQQDAAPSMHGGSGPMGGSGMRPPPRTRAKIGRPGYIVIRQKDPETGLKSLRFEV